MIPIYGIHYPITLYLLLNTKTVTTSYLLPLRGILKTFPVISISDNIVRFQCKRSEVVNFSGNIQLSGPCYNIYHIH